MQNLNLNKINLVKNIYCNKNIIIILIYKLNLVSLEGIKLLLFTKRLRLN